MRVESAPEEVSSLSLSRGIIFHRQQQRHIHIHTCTSADIKGRDHIYMRNVNRGLDTRQERDQSCSRERGAARHRERENITAKPLRVHLSLMLLSQLRRLERDARRPTRERRFMRKIVMRWHTFCGRGSMASIATFVPLPLSLVSPVPASAFFSLYIWYVCSLLTFHYYNSNGLLIFIYRYLSNFCTFTIYYIY